jgi:hypothetical protein
MLGFIAGLGNIAEIGVADPFEKIAFDAIGIPEVALYKELH